ncbi:FGGY family carbohydrate kinase [Streptomyces sp. TX20-6-3]|uniref:FGGY family carbohydrate kinase n=1 Tax=Streptomyces sp. TX20-6-3 TaxID=3028705 RepID=UPI0029B96B53|nr:FGGY family carbohydrate kinase [Streptomyces sp. TX20-6-3]MDX2561778.1 FGGY family carbohydrate kinase [Streptomyces sp. TX20-6-3]
MPTRRSVVIGVDSSTQSTKAAAVDADTGELLAVGRAPHTVTGSAGARESDPEDWWTALVTAVRAAVRDAGVPAEAVTGIAVAGQQHGLVTLGADGRPLRPALLWNDTRSAPQAAALAARLGGPAGWLARTGSVPVASMTAAKWQWLREHEPRHAEAVAGVRLPHDHLTERLTGIAVTDPGDASGTCWYGTGAGGRGAYDGGAYGSGARGTGAYDGGAYGSGARGTGAYDGGAYGSGTYDGGTHGSGSYDGGAYGSGTHGSGAYGSGAYDPEILDLIGLDPALLPAVAPGGATRVGTLTAAAAEALGLPRTVVVAAGTGDNMAAAVGLGLGGAGLLDHPVVSLGTSGTVFAATRARPADPGLAGFAATDGTYLPLGCTLNCTLAVDRFATLLGLDREDAAPGGSGDGGGGVVVLPYLDGERTPDLPHAAGLVTGLRHATDPRSILGAAYEGAAFTVLRALDQLFAACGLDPAAPDVRDRPLRLIGGGARGRAWTETVRRLSGRPLVVPAAEELVALGAAALAAGAVTGTDPVALTTAWGTGAGEVLPAVGRDEETWNRIAGVLSAATPTLLSSTVEEVGQGGRGEADVVEVDAASLADG